MKSSFTLLSSAVLALALLVAQRDAYASKSAYSLELSDTLEISGAQVKALAVAIERYQQWKGASSVYFCTLSKKGESYLVIVQPYSSNELRESIFGAREKRGKLRAGLSMSFTIDAKTLQIISEQPQR